jgi:branched-subunit amino acid transport protein
MVPAWLHILSIAALALGFACAAIIAADEARRPQPMWIMNVVWPVVAVFGTAATLLVYFRYGHARKNETPAAIAAAKATAHCGAGCTLGDICAEWLVFAVPAIATAFGWQTLFGEKIFAVWIVDYLFAFAFGILFQYFTIAPMRDLSPGAALVEALKADALSLTAWQVGMYGFMAIAQFVVFRHLMHMPLAVDSAEFWFMMQIAMLAGYATSYPVNTWLLHAGIKEAM